MRSIKFLAIALAGTLLLSCNNKDEEVAVPSGGNSKSLVLNLSGITTTTVSKAIAPKSSAGVINLNDITIYFTDGTNIYGDPMSYVLADPEFAEIVGGAGHIFHELDPAINKVIVIGNITGQTIVPTSVASIKSSTIMAAGERNKNNVLLYGEGILIPGIEPGTPHTSVSTDYFSTNVTIAPLVARYEVGGVRCLDLGTDYSSFRLAALGLVDISVSASLDRTVTSEKLSIYTGPSGFGKIYPWGASGIPLPPTGYEFTAGTELNWAYDVLGTPLSFTTTAMQYPAGSSTQVFAYNFLPTAGTFPNVKLRLSNVVPTGGVTSFNYVSTRSFAGTGVDETHPKPGYIYQFDLAFREINIGPFDPEAKICIGVNVTVSSWTIQALTPTFY